MRLVCALLGAGLCSGVMMTLEAAESASAGVTTGDLSREPLTFIDHSEPSIWTGEIGQGFREGIESFSLGLGAGYGVAAFGGHERHDLSLASLEYGRVLGQPLAAGNWFAGNFEFRAEFFAGAEFSPKREWLVGLTPHLRYNLAIGTRWVPFLDAGLGVSATRIGPPDLSGTFEFNLQATLGVHRFLRDNVALTFEARYLHMSCAGISKPNAGLNNVLGTIGVSWFF